MGTYSIRDLEKISGIKAHTLRIWESRYSILSPKRTDTNIRYYEDDDLRLLLSISMLNCNGFKISRIAKMSQEEIHETCHSLQEVCDEFGQQINALTLAMIEMDEARFEKVISNCTLRHGFEETMVKVVHPFLKQVGVLWQTGAIRPSQEHFISNLIRQKLIVAIDGQVMNRNPEAPMYLLYLPEWEQHENSLLFAYYVLRARGNRVTYLGQQLPEEDLTAVIADVGPDYILSIMTVSPPKESAEAYLRRIASVNPETKFLITGPATDDISVEMHNMHHLAHAGELLTFADGSAQRG